MARSLFAFGSNGNGQLGIGSDDDTSVPRSVQFVPPISFIARNQSLVSHEQHCNHHHDITGHDTLSSIRPFHDFASGGNHTALVTADHQRLYITGSNKDCESLLQQPTQVFRQLEIPQHQQAEQIEQVEQVRWRSVACGWAFTIAVTEPSSHSHLPELGSTDTGDRWGNTVYAWGSGAFGELGLGPGVSKTGHNAISIRTGLLSTTSLPLYPMASPLSTPDRFEVLKVRAGLRHVLLLAKQTNYSGSKSAVVLMGWGSNRQGQLGILEGHKSTSGAEGNEERARPLTEKELRGKFMEPTRILISKEQPLTTSAQNPVEVIDMACGQNHSLVLFSDGTVYASGLNKYGQLGPRHSAASTTSTAAEKTSKLQDFRIGFEQVVGLPFVDSISCGWNHNAAMDTRSVSSSGNPGRTVIYLWGRNDHGQLGHDTLALRTVYVDLSGTGNTVPGIVQLRIPTANSDQLEKEDHEEIVSYSCGSEHILAMTRSGICYAWGWNEHGNCGSGDVEVLKDVTTPRRVSFPTLSSHSDSGNRYEQGWVSGGYGSSWVWT